MTPAHDPTVDSPAGGAPRGSGRRVLSIALQLGLTVLVTWFILDRVGVGIRDVQALDARWWRPEPTPLLLASAVLVAGYFISAVLWARMVVDLGGTRVRPSRAIGLFMTANLGRYVPGKVWQILGLTYLSRSEGVGARIAGAAAVMGQLFALGGAAVVGTVALIQGSPLQRGVAAGSATVVATLALAFFVPALRDRALAALRKWRGTDLDTPRIDAAFGVRWAFYYLANWLIYAAAFWLFVMSYDPSVSFAQAGPAFAAAYVLGYVALFAPAGIGVREGALTALLAPTVGAAAAFALAVTSRLWLTAVELVPAAVLAGPTLKRAGKVGSAPSREIV